MMNVTAVIGISLRSAPMRRMSCSWCMPWMTEPEPRNSSALKNAWVTMWKMAADVGARADGQEHVAELADRGVREHLLDVVLGDGDGGGEQRRGARRRSAMIQRGALGATTASTGLMRHHQVHAGGDHGGGVDERRHRGGAVHGVGQPEVQRQLRALAAGADEQQQRDGRGRASAPSAAARPPR